MIGIGIFGWRDKHQLCAQRAQRVHFFLGLIVRHDDDRLVAQSIGHQRNPDTGVTGRTFNDCSAGLQVSARFCVADHVERCPILNRRTGVREFAFAVDLATSCLASSFEQDKRRVADQFERRAKWLSDIHAGGNRLSRPVPQ